MKRAHNAEVQKNGKWNPLKMIIVFFIAAFAGSVGMNMYSIGILFYYKENAMLTMISHEWLIAKRKHKRPCDWCRESFEIGEEYLKECWVDDCKYSLKFYRECYDALIETMEIDDMETFYYYHEGPFPRGEVWEG